jgi:hypothetical protein
MKKIILFKLLFITASTFVFFASEKPTKKEFGKFTEMFTPPANVLATIILAPRWPYTGCIKGKDNNPTIYVKEDDPIGRIINNERIKQCIEKNNLTYTITTVKKYFYEGCSIAIAIEPDISEADKYISYKEIKDLQTFQEQIGYLDIHPGNLKKCKRTGKWVPIDTEDNSFAGSALLSDRSQQECIKELYTFIYPNISHKSRRSFEKYQKKSAKNKNWTTPKNFLAESKRFDPPGIDFEKVKKEYSE